VAREARQLGPGQTLGPYLIEAVLGEGAMGVVFRASRGDPREQVALKVLRPELLGHALYERRFVHEARAASAVRHRHLVSVLEAGEADGRRYLAVAYVGGRSLGDRLEAEGPLPPDDLLRLVSEVGAGLDALHAAGLVHRDVKPENILLDERGSAALTDFGLARGPAYTVLTSAGHVVGTLDYMAPELMTGSDASPASDLYALGCVVFECIAGFPPFSGKSVLAVGTAHVSEDPPDPLAARTDLPRALSWAVLQALAKDPADRPRTATMYGHMLRLAAKS
jgi:serine/threonine protein kinase